MDVSKLHWMGLVWLLLPCLAATSLDAADRIKFGASSEKEIIQTQPLPATGTDLPAPSLDIGNVNANVAPPVISEQATTVVRPGNNGDDQQANWIFRDTQSARGIQRALGVEVFDAGNSSGEQKPTSEVEAYFSRQNLLGQNGLGTEQTELFEEFDSSLGGIGSPGTENGLFGSKPDDQSILSIQVGQTGFQNTINSKNPSIRSYYRNLYRNQITPTQPVVPALDSVLSQEQERTRTRELFNRAARIESMTPKGPASVFENSQASAAVEPTVTPRKRRDTEAPLIQRRGGQIIIPSRPY